MATPADNKISAPGRMKIKKIKVKIGQKISKGTLCCLYTTESNDIQRFKSNDNGVVKEIHAKDGDEIEEGFVLFTIQGCSHPTVMKDMCAECGADLRLENSTAGNRKEGVTASVAMVHSIPELIVSEQQAKELGKADEDRLLKTRKLVLLVDLDQTLIHTTNDNIPPNLKDVHHFQLWHGNHLLWYHTRLRPQTVEFLEHISKLYELHICTFGVRLYAHTIAKILDPKGKFFSHRILSRDECFDPQAKTANLKALFPCGDSMVCIIDDREDVWHFSPNLVHVKPYRFFQGTADINAPPGLTKTEEDDKPIVHRVRRVSQSSTGSKDGDGKEDSEQKEKGAEDGSGETKSDGDNQREIKSSADNREGKSGSTDEHIKEKVETESEKDDSMKRNVNNDSEGDIGGNEEKSKAENSNSERVAESKDQTVEIEQKAMEVSESSRENQDTEGLKDNKELGSDQNKTGSSGNSEGDTTGISDKENTSSEGKASEEIQEKGGSGETNLSSENKEENGNDVKENEEEELIEWDDDDDYLLYLEEILKTIHKTFYNFYDQLKEKGSPEKDSENEKPNLKNIIPYIKKKVLKGCNILFSGVIPTNMNPEKSRAYTVAKSLGAEVHQELRYKGNEKDSTKFTTHLVAARSGTNKVRTAMKYKHVKIVNANWLWSCAERWEKVEEVLFQLGSDADDTGRDSPDLTKLPKKKDLKRKHAMDDKTGEKQKRQKIRQSDNTDTDGMDVEDEFQNAAEEDISDLKNSGKQRKDSFSMTYNPILAFSDDDLAYMDKEVDDEIADEEDPSSEEETERETRIRDQVLKCQADLDVSSSEDSLTGDMPRGWRKTSPAHSSDDEAKGSSSPEELGPEYESETDQDKFEKIMDAFGPDTENSEDEYPESVGSVDDEIADAVVKEFLS